LASDAQIPVQKHKKYEKQGNMTPPKVNNSAMMVSNDSEVVEISKNSKG
jgi:hypothetical protein